MRRFLSVLLIISLCLSLNLTAAYAGSLGPGSTRSIAIDLYGQSTNKPEAVMAESSAEDAVTTGSSINYVEALVQSYEPAQGEYAGKQFTIDEDTRFFIVDERQPSKDLVNSTRLIAAQFATMKLPSEESLDVVYQSIKHAKAGDIILKQVEEDAFFPGCDPADIKEAYTIEITDRVVVTACDSRGMYYGLLTLLQMAIERGDKNDEIKLNCCEISDGPDVAERTIMLDCGRKYFSPKWIKNLIKRASFQRYNAIELHFSEAECLRFDSEVFPWLTEGVKSLSREEMTDIIQTANIYNIEIIPSLDTPGHNEYIVKKYAKQVKENPDWYFECEGEIFNKETEGFSSIANYYSRNGEIEKADYIGIDITKKSAVAFMNALIDDYADYFAELGCDKMNIGGDEVLGWYSLSLGDESFDYETRWQTLEHWETYAREELKIKNGSASDTFVSYINDLATRVESKGYEVRIFNDEININDDQHVKLKSSVEIIMWSKAAKNYTSITEAGHKVHIDPEQWCYYVVRENNGEDIMLNKYSNVNAKRIFEKWNPINFTTSSGSKHRPSADQMAGAYFNIWCDTPSYKTDRTIWKETSMRTWANSSKMWNAEISKSESGITKAIDYEELELFVKKAGDFPGYGGNPNKHYQLKPVARLRSSTSLIYLFE